MSMNETRAFGPKTQEHIDAVADGSKAAICPACSQRWAVGDYTTLISLGPGADEEERAKCRMGYAYNAIAVEVHFGCATGNETPS